MPLNLPLDAFSAGQQAGRASSPVSGLGDAIRGILDTARKGGLLQAQSQAQSAGANQNAILKEGRAAIRGEEMVDQTIIGPGGRTNVIQQRRDAPRPVTEPAMQAESAIQTVERMSKEQQDRINQPTVNPIAGAGVEARAIAFLEENGAQATPANIQAVIERGLVE